MRALIVINGEALEVLRLAVGICERADARGVNAEVVVEGPPGTRLPTEAILLEDISILHLPSMTENALRERGTDLIHQLLSMRVRNLYHIRNIGTLGIKRIEEGLAELGLKMSP